MLRCSSTVRSVLRQRQLHSCASVSTGYIYPSNNSGSVRHASQIKKVAVVGLGLMGHGVAQVTAQAGFEVLAIEMNQKALDAGMKRIEGSLGKIVAKDVKKGKYASEVEGKAAYDAIMQRISTSTDMADAAKGDCDLVIEAIVEIEDLKIDFYKKLGGMLAQNSEKTAHTILASNTSSLSITPMALASGRPEKFVGLHFFNPVQIMRLLEVVRTEHTDEEVFDAVTQFGGSIGKTAVKCQDTPGFIVNRLLIPYLCQAMAMLDRQEASVQDIDVSMQLGAGHPMGPLTLADYVGLDTALNIVRGWKEAYPDEPAFIVPECLERLVEAGYLGRKSGRGFYLWEGDKPAGIAPSI